MRRIRLALGVVLILIGLLGMTGVLLYYGFTGGLGMRKAPQGGPQVPSTRSIDPALLQLMLTDFSKSQYASNGERVYLTGEDDRGAVITIRSGYVPFGNMMGGRGFRGMMANFVFSCVNCHGPDAQGSYVFPDGKTESADIRWSALTDPGDVAGEEGDTATDTTEKDRGEPETYDAASFKKAVKNGVEPNGERLSYYMPRWDISDADIDDLIAYLKTL